MSPRDLATLMRCEWAAVFEAREDGTFRLTVPPLADFEMFGTREELDADWREALRSHLAGYLAVGKAVPVPTYRLSDTRILTGGEKWEVDTTEEERAAHRIVLNERLEKVG